MPWYYLTVAGGGFSTGFIPTLADKVVDILTRDGITYRKKESGLPSGKEFNFDLTTGQINFDTTGAPFFAGEQINIKWSNPIAGTGITD